MKPKIVSLSSLFIVLVACAHEAKLSKDRIPTTLGLPSEINCEISKHEREAILKLDYQAFDQSLPDGGWRKYESCLEITRNLIDDYTKVHTADLQKSDRNNLIWHSGQLSASMGDYPRAIASMEQTFREGEKPTDNFLWNDYVKATIAFMKKDRESLVSERAKLAKGSSPYNHLNLRKVDAFVRCFESSYQAAYSETCEPSETEEGRIKSLAIELDYKKPLPPGPMSLQEILELKKIIMLGEIHGTQEAPELFGNLVASVANENSKTAAILEIPQSSQDSIDRFIKTGDKNILKQDPFFTRKDQDGRSSKAMVRLLRTLAKLPNVTVLCMDPMTGSQTMKGQDRDVGMAAFINSQRKNFDRVLVLSGNIHSSLAVGTRWDKDYRPMGLELKKMVTDLKDADIFNILVRSEKVDSWNCRKAEASSCQARYGKKVPTPYSTAVPWNSYFIAEGAIIGPSVNPRDGHIATIFIRSTKVSPPFGPNAK